MDGSKEPCEECREKLGPLELSANAPLLSLIEFLHRAGEVALEVHGGSAGRSIAGTFNSAAAVISRL